MVEPGSELTKLGLSPDEGVAFAAVGAVELMGEMRELPFVGTLRALSDEARARLELPEGEILLATGELEITLRESALADDADAFDSESIVVRASLVLRHRPRASQPTDLEND